MKISIIIPAYNEEKRIGKTLTEYASFFEGKKINHEFIVVLNGCTDNTLSVVQDIQKKFFSIHVINLTQAGKGLAVVAGFKDALTRDNDLIGFVDADMAIRPEQFLQLIKEIGSADGIIASRYMAGAQLYPPRPAHKEVVRLLVFKPMVNVLFGMWYKDFQCGAKLFKRAVIEKVAPVMVVKSWAFDVDLLYLCKKNSFTIKEIPTVWYDQDLSTFNLFTGGANMFVSLIKLRFKR